MTWSIQNQRVRPWVASPFAAKASNAESIKSAQMMSLIAVRARLRGSNAHAKTNATTRNTTVAAQLLEWLDSVNSAPRAFALRRGISQWLMVLPPGARAGNSKTNSD